MSAVALGPPVFFFLLLCSFCYIFLFIKLILLEKYVVSRRNMFVVGNVPCKQGGWVGPRKSLAGTSQFGALHATTLARGSLIS